MEEFGGWILGVIAVLVAIYFAIIYTLAAVWVFLVVVCHYVIALFDWVLCARLIPQLPFVSWVFWGAILGGCLGFWTIAPVYGLRKLRPALIWLPPVLMVCVALLSSNVNGLRFTTQSPTSRDQPAPVKANRIKVLTTAPVRISPQKGTKVVLRLKQGFVVEKIGWSNKYYRIQTGDKEGWIHSSYVKEVNSDVPLSIVGPKQNRLRFSFVYQHGPDAGFRQWSQVSDNRWTETYPDGQTRIFSVVGPSTVDGVKGTIVRFVPNGYMDVFIPDKRSRSVMLKFRNRGETAWANLAEITWNANSR